MKNRQLALLVITVLLGFSLASFGAEKFSGDIMDSSCAMMGSHAKMEAMHHMPASSALTGKAAKMCTLQCVKMGGHFVLYNPSTKKTYKLDPESDAQAYAGERVSVTGTLNGDTIQVEKISKRSL
ncbi:MAG: DUF5818 domain-containing protein [Terriglobia bacterium]